MSAISDAYMTKREYVQAMQWTGKNEDFPKFEVFASRAEGGFTKLTIDNDGWLRPWWGEKETHGCEPGAWLVLRRVEMDLPGKESFLSLEVVRDYVFKKRYEVADKPVTLEPVGMSQKDFIEKWGREIGDNEFDELTDAGRVYWMALYELEKIQGPEGRNKVRDMARDFMKLEPPFKGCSSYWHARDFLLNMKR